MSKENTLLQTDEINTTSSGIKNIGIFQFEVDSNKVSWNDALKEIHQVPKAYIPDAESIYGNCKEGIYKERLSKEHTQALSSGDSFELEYEVITATGNSRLLNVDVHAINDNGKCTSLHGIITDITNINKNNTDTYILKKQLEFAEKLANSGSWKWDICSNKLTWTNNFYNILKHNNESPLSFETFLEYVHEDDKEKIAAKFDLALKTKRFPNSNYRIVLKDGTIKNMKSIGEVITDVHGEVITVMGTCQDITESKERNQQLLQKNQQLELTENSNEAGTWSWNPITGMFKWSENLYEIMDFDKNIPMNFEVLYTRIHPEDKHIVDDSMQLVQDTGVKRTFTHRIIINDGSIRTLEIVADIVSNKFNNQPEFIGTARDITNTLNIAQELNQKDQLLNFSEQLTTMGYWKYKPSINDVYWSDNLYHIFDQSKKNDVTFETYFHKIHPDDKNFVKKRILQSIKENKFYDFTHRIILKSNKIRVIQIIGKVTVNKIDGLQELLGTCLDITESHSKDLELTEKNYRLNVAEKMAMIGYWQWNTPTNEVIWSDNLYDIYGHDEETPITFETYINYIHKEDREHIVTKLTNAMEHGAFPESTYRIQLEDGTIKTIKSLGKITRNKKGEVLEMTGVCQDITEAKTRELELIQKNQQLSLAEQMAKLGSWQWQPEKEIFKWSDNHYRIYGYEPGELIDLEKSLAKIYPPDLEKVKRVTYEIISGIEHNEINYRIKLDEDTIKTLEVRGITAINEAGDLEITGTTQDITSRVKAEKEIKEKNHLLSVSEEMAIMGSWKWNPSTGVSTWSDNLYKIYGLELHDPITIDLFLSIVHPDDVDKTNKHIKSILDTHKSDKKLSFRIIKQNGDIRSLDLVSEIIEDQNGNIKELIGTTQDVTAKIKAEEKINKKNQLLSYAEEIAMMGSWHFDVHNNKLKWSDNLYKIYGLEVNSPMSMNVFYSKIHPDDLEIVKEQVQKCIEGDENIKPIFFRIILNNGNILYIESIAGITKNHLGEVVEIAGTAQDITERLKIEKDILEKNQLLNFAEQLSSIGHWKWDIVNDVMENSENLLKILDFNQETKLNFNTYINRVHPADREKVIDVSRKIIETKKFDKFHHRIIKNDNSIRSIKLIGEVILDSEGNVIELIGSSQDITEQIEAQKKILDANRSLEKSTINLTSKNKQLAEFNHITSHNLRSPVSNLNALLGLYKNTQNESKKVEIFGKFEIVIDHLTETLNALIETISIKHSANEITQELYFAQTLLKTKEILAAELIESKADIRCDFSKAKNVKYNPIYLESIFLNLVSNSLKYRSEDRVPEISITSNTVNGRITLKFEDNGLGIDMKSNGHKLFGLNKVFHKHPEAKGIGLFLTKAQIVAMGGSISAKSTVNVGTTFFIILN
ncbi:PAS domain-containing protein [Maribacter sp. 1_MG-2023]|uniref:PAS domain-containing protein n=1 Tax=Maribacter sp. 1_MG-2023 TaxID=3062677 RepID=UPI0026E29E42|nr:PAS domain-containing protein [Maribacter sp. 1_MG-2023]MDO6471335.1 PAS domain-containing protein [Maribacter sp. 1_MG-2023]